jgi:tetratricopeptide (TPR) repeat protein
LDIAFSSFEQAKAIEPQNRAVLDSFAEYYRVTGQSKKAEELLSQSQDQKLLWAHYYRTGRYEDARSILEQLYKTNPKDIETIKGLLIVAEKLGSEEMTRKYSEELLSLDNNADNRLIQIQTFLTVGLIKEAEYKLQSFKETYPDDPRSLLIGAWVAMRQGQLKNALENVNRSLEINQNNATAWRIRGQINFLMANYDQAVVDLKNSSLLQDEPVTRAVLARAYMRIGREEDAITELKNIVDQPHAPAEIRELLEQIYWQLNKKEALKKFYDDSLEKYSDELPLYNRAATFATSMNDYAKAEKLYHQAWEKSTKSSQNDTAYIGGYLQALILGGKFDKAFEEAGKYVDGPFAPIALFRIAEAKSKQGDKAAAIQYCRKAIDKAGANEDLVANILQKMYALLGSEEVLKYCNERLGADPDSFAAADLNSQRLAQ